MTKIRLEDALEDYLQEIAVLLHGSEIITYCHSGLDPESTIAAKRAKKPSLCVTS